MKLRLNEFQDFRNYAWLSKVNLRTSTYSGNKVGNWGTNKDKRNIINERESIHEDLGVLES